ncbi:MAG: hypothetical protein Q4A18_04085 [Rikenellaceae bacterium]|nr:hypothetical protein [Rikenellaceae bacterium]
MKKIKLAILTLMGFSTACSTVKNTAKNEPVNVPTEQEEAPAIEADTTRIEPIPEIKLMYGVPRPKQQQSEE